jgi:hypothetical protein
MGNANSAYSFNGSSAFITAPVNASETSYTASLWFQTTDPNCGLFSVTAAPNSIDHDRHIYLSSGNLSVRIWSDETIKTTGTNYADGNWHHVVHLFDSAGTPQRIYVDGVLKVTGNKSSSNWDGQSIVIGFSQDAGNKYANGKIDQVRIYNRALSASEVDQLYSAEAPPISETFGSGSNLFSIDFVRIGNPGNEADTTGSPNPAGSVAYNYNIGKYEISRDMINKANTVGSLGITLQDMTSNGGNGVNRPATGVSWYEAAKYVNWLNSSKGFMPAYKFDGSGNFQLWSSTDAGYNANNQFRNSLAKYWLPSSNEWYKAAYGNLNGTWNNYATGSDSAPTAVASGTAANTAVYGQTVRTGPADITNAGGLSPYGTMGQGGNAFEWMETAVDGSNNTAGEDRELRGGDWANSGYLIASSRYNGPPSQEYYVSGFRVASVPEPSALSLFAIGLGGLALVRRRKQAEGI